MLTQIREKIVGPIGLAILAIIAVSFVFFGASLNFAGNVYAAKVEGSEISIGEFENGVPSAARCQSCVRVHAG